jgi:hypothetical protein
MIGQPKDYSEMLKRIFWSTLIVGLICTLSLGYKSPEINKLLNLSPKEWNLGPIAFPVISVLIPLGITILSRWITLHDLLSDIFHIRERFDINHILLRLAEGVGYKIDKNIKMKFKEKRYSLMRDTFYKYAPNVDKAVINSQSVSEALDRWGWLWCFLEASVIIFLSTLIACWFVSLIYALWYFLFFILFIILAILTYPSCKKAAEIEVEDILNDKTRRKEIFEVFDAL